MECFRHEAEGGAGLESGGNPFRVGGTESQEADVSAGAVDEGERFVFVERKVDDGNTVFGEKDAALEALQTGWIGIGHGF